MINYELIKLKKQFTSDLWINLHTTEYCNLDCIYCYYKEKKRILPKYNLDYIFNFIKRSKKPIVICFYGGEPCLNMPFIEKVIKESKNLRKKVFFTIQTNGTLINSIAKETINEFYMVGVSIDGRKEVMDSVRGKGIFDIVIDNVKKIKKYYKKPIMARMTLTEKNNIYKDVKELMNHFDYIYWQIDNNLGKRKNDKFKYSYTKELNNIFRYWIKELKEGKHKILIPFYGAYILFKTISPNKDFYYHCSPGFGSITIDSKGSIYSCPEGVSRSNIQNNYKSYIGNIKNCNNFYINKYKLRKECRDCNWGYICGGRCIWTNEKFYCDCSKKLIGLIKKNINLIENVMPFDKIKDDFAVLFNTEIMP